MANVIYANARAVSSMRSLLGIDRLFRMADAGANGALKILAEVNFGEGIAADALGYETLVNAEEKKLIAFIKEAAPSEKLMRFFLAPNDYHNAEAAMRAKYLKTDISPMLTEEGLYLAETLREKIFADEYGGFPKPLAEALQKADVLFVAKKADGRTVSALFKKALYADLFELSSSDKLLKTVYRVKANAADIAVAFRSRSFASAKEQFVAGGSLSGEELRLLCEESPEVIREKFRYSDARDLIFAAAEDFSEGRPLADFERIADGCALKFLKKEKYDDGGCRPFLMYCYYKYAELLNVRIVMSSLNNGLAGDAIKARLRETYEG